MEQTTMEQAKTETKSAPEQKEKKPRHRSIRPILYLALTAVITVAVCITVSKTAKPKVTTQTVLEKLEKASELTTAKMSCTGLVKYTDGKIPFLNEEAFSMIYSAQVRAGVDLSQVEVEVTRNKVTITLPEVTVQNMEVNEDSVEFYDKKFVLFKGNSEEAVVEAIRQAKQDIEQKPEVAQLKETAKEQTVTLLTNLFTDTIGDRTLEIQFKQEC